jgi:hypothetical protein
MSERNSRTSCRATAFAARSVSDFEAVHLIRLYLPKSLYWILRRGFFSDFTTLWPCSARYCINISCAPSEGRNDEQIGLAYCSKGNNKCCVI